ncbi:CocE/NonD family hydrolase [Streptomyces capparidis]
MPAPDGAALATDWCLPEGAGPFPTVLLRTPYDRRSHHAELRGWARRGFAAVVQDVRGRHGSGGGRAWSPYRREADDGAAAVRWCRERPWSDGAVVACGASYAAHCALVLALHPDPAARADAVIAAVPALGLAETAREDSGVERLYGRAGWWAAHGDRADSDPDFLERALRADPGLLAHLPVTDLPRRLGRALPSWTRLWDAAPADVAGAARDGAVPLLAVGGTHDVFASATVALWRAWGGRGGGPARLLLGPWGHGLTAQPGPDAHGGHRVRLGVLYASFARAALAGALRGRGGAAALGGTGSWLPAAALDSGVREVPLEGGPWSMRVARGAAFTADPARPVRSDRLDVPADGEPDRCLAVGAPLPADCDLAGHVEARLAATWDTPSADWAVRLVALTPRGTAEPLGTGIARVAGPAAGPREVRVRLGPLVRRLPAGTRLRVEVAGHHFPAHARNPHTGEDPVRATAARPSRRTVAARHSRLLLPVPGPAAARTVRPEEETLR